MLPDLLHLENVSIIVATAAGSRSPKQVAVRVGNETAGRYSTKPEKEATSIGFLLYVLPVFLISNTSPASVAPPPLVVPNKSPDASATSPPTGNSSLKGIGATRSAWRRSPRQFFLSQTLCPRRWRLCPLPLRNPRQNAEISPPTGNAPSSSSALKTAIVVGLLAYVSPVFLISNIAPSLAFVSLSPKRLPDASIKRLVVNCLPQRPQSLR